MSFPEFPRILILIVLLLQAGCGFQLKGTDVAGVEVVRLIGSSEAPATFRVLREELDARGVQTTSASDALFTIELLDEESMRRTVATTDVIDAAEYELGLELMISIYEGDEVVLENDIVVAERVYEVDTANLSGSFEEQRLLMSEMRTELAEKVIRRLERISAVMEPRTAGR